MKTALLVLWLLKSRIEMPIMFFFTKKLNTEDACKSLVEDFYKAANGITSLVVLAGCINHNMHWKDLSEEQWNDEMTMNLNIPFFLLVLPIS